MASLTGQKIKDTYQSLLKTDDNGLVTNAFKNITDGSGSASGLYLKNDGVLLSGSVDISGSLNAISITGSLQGTSSFAITASHALNAGADTGDITFEGIKIIGAGTGSGDGYGYSTIELVPDNNLYNNNQYLILDPTTPNHIHIRAGGAIDSSSAYLYLGGEKSNVVVRNLDNSFNEKHWVQINSQTGSTQYTWTFDDDGKLNMPGALEQGSGVVATGNYSHAEGNITQAIGDYSHAEGDNTRAVGNYSHAEGQEAISVGSYSHAEGYDTRAIGNYSHVEGAGTKTGTQNAYYAESVVSGVVTLSGSYGDVSGEFAAENRLYLYDLDNNNNRRAHIISQSYFDSTNTIVELYDTGVNATTAYVGNLNLLSSNGSWNGDQTIPGLYSHAEGFSTSVLGFYSHAEGRYSIAAGDFAHAEGNRTQALNDYSHAEGRLTIASRWQSHAEGNRTHAGGISSHAEGDRTVTLGEGSHAEGDQTIASGSFSHAEGYQTIASGSYSPAEGDNTQAIGEYSHAEGQEAISVGIYSHAEGYDTRAIGNYSHAEGAGTKTGTQNAYSTSVVNGVITLSGSYGDVSGDFSNDSRLYLYNPLFNQKAIYIISQSYFDSNNTIVELYDISVNTTIAYVGDLGQDIANWTGDQTIPGYYSHAEGELTQALGWYSHAEGYDTQAIGNASHAEGYDTRAIGPFSHAEGYATQAIGQYSHAEGNVTQAIGQYSHAEGDSTNAIGGYSHAEGQQTQAIGLWSHAEGSSTRAIGSYSHAEGSNTVASGSAQHVSGKFNEHNNDSSIFVVGIGLDDTSRKDGFTVDVDANGSGSVMIPSCIDFPENPKTGSMYFDPANEYLWIYTGVNWRYTPLQAITP